MDRSEAIFQDLFSTRVHEKVLGKGVQSVHASKLIGARLVVHCQCGDSIGCALGGRSAHANDDAVLDPCRSWNDAARTGAFGPSFQKILEPLKPEAAYFTALANGERGGFIVFDMKDTSQIPGIAEPFFLAFNAKVNFFPVMNAEDLAKANPGIEKAVKAHAKTKSA